MLRALELSDEDHEVLIARCEARSITFLSTPFDPGSLDLLAHRFHLATIKLGSGELTNGPLLLQAAQTGRKLIVSTGMGDLAEVEDALRCWPLVTRARPRHRARLFSLRLPRPRDRRRYQEKVTLLHCTTEYPTPLADINLAAMDTLRQRFGLGVGFSDHSEGIVVAIAAAARGATVIEKHFTLDRNLRDQTTRRRSNPPH